MLNIGGRPLNINMDDWRTASADVLKNIRLLWQKIAAVETMFPGKADKPHRIDASSEHIANGLTVNTVLAATDDKSFSFQTLAAIGGVTGTGADGYVTLWTGASTISYDSTLYFDRTNDRLGVGTITPDRRLHAELLDTTKNAVSYPLRLTHTYDGTVDDIGNGTGLEFETETYYGMRVGGSVESYQSVMFNGADDFNLALRTMINDTLTTMLTLDGQNERVITPYDIYVGTTNYLILPDVFEIMAEPTGFPNRTDSIWTWTGTGIIIGPVSGSYDIYFDGIKHTISGNKTITVADTEGLHWIYFDTDDALHELVNPTIGQVFTLMRDYCLVALVYWDATNNSGVYVGEERHGCIMDAYTHYYLHYTRGLQWISDGDGLALGDFVIGNGSLDSHAQFSTTEGAVSDEDIGTTISAKASTTGMPILYKDGASANWRSVTQTGFSCYQNPAGTTNRLMYNQYTGGAWQLTEVGEGDYVLYHIYATSGKTQQLYAIMGEAEYTTRPAARLGAQDEIGTLQVDDLPSAEMIPIATVIFQTDKDYGNSINARIVEVDAGGDYYIDWRYSELPRGTAPTDHGSLTGLLDDDHSQYLLLAGRAGGQIAYGGTAASEDLYLRSTVNATKGDVIVADDGGNVLLGGASSIIYATTMPAGEDDSVVILDSDGSLRTDEIDSRVWGTTLVDMANGADNRVVTATDANSLNGEANLTFDGSLLYVNGMVGVGEATLSAWKTATYSVLTIGDTDMSLYGEVGGDAIGFAANAYFDVTNSRWEYVGSDRAGRFHYAPNGFAFYRAVSGTADNAITWGTLFSASSTGGHAFGLGELADVTLNFGIGAEVTNVGQLVWMEDEDYFQFNDDVLINAGENLSVGAITADRRFHVEVSDAETAAITYTGRFTHVSTGTTAAGFGTGVEFEVENNHGNNLISSTVESVLSVAGGASTDYDLTFKTAIAGSLVEFLSLSGENERIECSKYIWSKANASHCNLYLEENSGSECWSLGVGATGDLNFYDDAGVIVSGLKDGTTFGHFFVQSSATSSYLEAYCFSETATNAPTVNFVRSHTNTMNSHVATVDGDYLSRILTYGVHTGGGPDLSAEIRVTQVGDADADAVPSKMDFYTSGSGASPVLALTIDEAQDVYSVAWTNYSDTSTIVGWDTETYNAKKIWYKKIGKLIFCQFLINGTSNSVNTSFTLPYSIDTGLGSNTRAFARIRDASGAYTTGMAMFPTSGAVFTLYKDMSDSAWTASDIKHIEGEFWYEST